MRKIRELRNKKGYSLGDLSKMTGVPKSTIADFEKGKIKNLNEENLNRIADVLECSSQELKIEIIENDNKKMECRNEVCPLNKNKLCANSVVLSERAPCYGKDKVQAKEKKVKFNNTKALFVK